MFTGFPHTFTTQNCNPYRALQRPCTGRVFLGCKDASAGNYPASSAPPSSRRKRMTTLAPDPGRLTMEATLGRWTGAEVGRSVSLLAQEVGNTADPSRWPGQGRGQPQPPPQPPPQLCRSNAEERPENPALRGQQVLPNRFPRLLVFPRPPRQQLPSQVTS